MAFWGQGVIHAERHHRFPTCYVPAHRHVADIYTSGTDDGAYHHGCGMRQLHGPSQYWLLRHAQATVLSSAVLPVRWIQPNALGPKPSLNHVAHI